MKKLMFIILFVFLSVTIYAEKTDKEANVNWLLKDGKTEYSITFHPEYKINLKAPFNFFLLDSSKNQISKIEWDSFVKDESGKYSFISEKKEKFTKYWFVACKYSKDEVIACKTFSQTIEIK